MVVSKSVHTRLPDVAFKQYVRDDIVLPEEPSKKSAGHGLSRGRDASSFDEVRSEHFSTTSNCFDRLSIQLF